MKTVTFTCDHESHEGDMLASASFYIYTEIQNESTVYHTSERHSCDNALHLGELVGRKEHLSNLVDEVMKRENPRKFAMDKWRLRDVVVTRLNPRTGEFEGDS